MPSRNLCSQFDFCIAVNLWKAVSHVTVNLNNSFDFCPLNPPAGFSGLSQHVDVSATCDMVGFSLESQSKTYLLTQ